MIIVSEAAAGPANVGHMDRAKGVNDVAADSANIRDARIRSDPNSAVDAIAEMLGELAEDVAIDPGASAVRFDFQANWNGLLRKCRQGLERNRSCEGANGNPLHHIKKNVTPGPASQPHCWVLAPERSLTDRSMPAMGWDRPWLQPSPMDRSSIPIDAQAPRTARMFQRRRNTATVAAMVSSTAT